ncbi:Hint domain-containing protein [Gluconobacter wancherniae]|uniref:Hedgehog/Intein (Hint) domain-containing protein n=1 Tax=Gluconobacter wancherniae NBRC 103581 TaxID=656744 RepID=A0A511B0Q6_9PROT|nr:Hint domain-containing protein [Gluconobacter wancherniae]MBF0854137.1 hypothetical protein [Gluconobacter wancherniae]GBD57193.1 tRNA (methyladenosine) methyltransferase [Gluconobacter wancherniae NBRC 103581]GBR65354.1 hypothetical protein AA103581_1784 [Gluconobacter wancherniae NBRC 103581]GEK94035.1 hypothetical protein GWA01_18050 [Gluconobacter wancherniae NBRC 103581]
MTALVNVNAGVATIYSSGDLSGLAGLSAISSIVVTKNSQTPAGDNVVVDLTTGLAGIQALSSVTVQNGATAKVGGGLLGASVGTSLTVNGGILDIAGQALSIGALTTITVGSAGGEIKVEPTGLSAGLLTVPVQFVDSSGNTTTTIPKNFVMDFPSSKSIPATYNVATNTTTIGDGVSLLGVLGAGRVITLSGDPFGLKSTGTPEYAALDIFHVGSIIAYSKTFTQSDGSGGVITCFLPGTLIATDEGDSPVEQVLVGDFVSATVGDQKVSREVIWVGSNHVQVRPELSDDRAGYPVRILKNAISENVPFKDMLITSEHCLCIDGNFIPARMLVNGISIFYDKTITSYDYYHIETAEHSVITADGMLTESYLDTGNRKSFQSDANVVRIGAGAPAVRSWSRDAAAPLVTARSIVEPVFRQIETRAKTQGIKTVSAAPQLCEDAELRLVTDKGHVIRKLRETDGVAMFMIPSDVTAVSIISRTSRPSDTIGPFVDDRRELGVLIGEITLFDAVETRRLDTPFTDSTLEGWDVLENSACRWTNGKAALPLGQRRPHSIGMLAIRVLEAGPYLVTDEAAQSAAAFA